MRPSRSAADPAKVAELAETGAIANAGRARSLPPVFAGEGKRRRIVRDEL